MRDVENVKIGEMEFQLLPMPIMEAWKWDRKILQIITPLVKALSGMSTTAPVEGVEESAELDFDKVSEALSDALTSLTDEQFESLVKGLTRYATRIDCQIPIPLGSNSGVEKAFADATPIDLYKLLFEIARYNKFSPFALAGGGNRIGEILGSFAPSAAKKMGMSLDRLAPSTP